MSIVGIFDLLGAGQATLADASWSTPVQSLTIYLYVALVFFFAVLVCHDTHCTWKENYQNQGKASVFIEKTHCEISYEYNDQIITMKNVNKWFGNFHVLRDIELNVKKGERIVICGPSGSGKSTLIRCLNRLEEHQSGDINRSWHYTK